VSERAAGTTLRVLHLEDDPNDAELIQAEIETHGFQVAVVRVTTRDAFSAALEAGGLDLVLSDFSLPQFDGLSALEVARQIAPEVPFIAVSGRLGEEAAVECVRAGATDYVLKQRLSRLGPAVRRALDEADERRKRRQAEEALQRSEAQLRQAQKLEPLGRLAGGVAHDFNNLLTVILGYAQSLEMRLKADGKGAQDAAEITRAARRAAELTRQLLAFSRQQLLEPRVVDLNLVVKEIDTMLRRLIGEDIDLVTATTAGLGRVVADPGQVGQVLMNLAVNARDAMPEGGKLTIETANVEVDQGYVRGRVDLAPGRHVLLAVSDTGCGMSSEVVSRIFEPFFTTKGLGSGTGLGLSTVHGIVKQTGGHIEVYSEPGQGTTFKIYFPAVAAEVSAPPAARANVQHDPRGNETILLVEDEEMIRRMLREGLQANGYTVLEAADGSEAFGICERPGQSIDLLITDVVMPLMSGPELAQRVAATRPDLRVLFISGYTDRALVHQGRRDAGTAFLQKPFTPDVLGQKVRELLDKPREQAA